MKLKSYFLLGIAALSLSACTGNYDDWADPQGFDPEATRSITFTATGIGKVVDLMTDTSTNVPVAIYSTPQGADTAKVVYQLKLFAANKATTTVTANAGGTVNRDTINAALLRLYGKNLVERDMKALVYAYTDVDGQAVYGRSDTIDVRVSPFAPYKIATSYKAIVAGQALAMIHNDANNVYDDPNFSVTFQADANATWQVVPESGSLYLAPATATSLTGNLTEGTSSSVGTIAEKGWYTLTVNMYTRSYTLTKLSISPYLWVPGNHQTPNAWDIATAPVIYSAKMDRVYSGFLYLDGIYKFTSEASWSGTNYGYASDSKLSTDGGASNLNASAGFYFIKVNLNELSYSLTPVTTMSIIGDAVGGWSTANDVDMTFDKATGSYSVTTNLSANGMKFRVNHDWAISLGGATDALTTDNGSNIQIATAGTYVVTLYPTYDGNSRCTIVKK